MKVTLGTALVQEESSERSPDVSLVNGETLNPMVRISIREGTSFVRMEAET